MPDLTTLAAFIVMYADPLALGGIVGIVIAAILVRLIQQSRR